MVCEGVTDYAVLKNILLGYFKGQPRQPRFTQRQPDSDATGEAGWQQFGSWENVFRYLREGLHRDALEFNEYVIVQVDADQSDHPNFGVPQQEGGRMLSPEEMVERIAVKLREIIGPGDCAAYALRMIFAICVRDIECWLLPLWETGVKAAKTTGCLTALNSAIARNNEPTINPDHKDPRRYEAVSRGYRKQATLLKDGPKNPSLAVFLGDLRGHGIELKFEA